MKKLFIIAFFLSLCATAQRNSFPIDTDLDKDGEVDYFFTQITQSGFCRLGLALSSGNTVWIKKSEDPNIILKNLDFDGRYYNILIHYNERNDGTREYSYKNDGAQIPKWGNGNPCNVSYTIEFKNDYLNIFINFDGKDYVYKIIKEDSNLKFYLID